jgi:hypothetical protein
VSSSSAAAAAALTAGGARVCAAATRSHYRYGPSSNRGNSHGGKEDRNVYSHSVAEKAIAQEQLVHSGGVQENSQMLFLEEDLSSKCGKWKV